MIAPRETEIPNTFPTFKEFVKQGKLEWILNEENKYSIYLENKNKKLVFFTENGLDEEGYIEPIKRSVVSKTIFVKKGIYEIEFNVFSNHEDCFTIGVCNLDFNIYTDYLGNDKDSRGVSGDGFYVIFFF